MSANSRITTLETQYLRDISRLLKILISTTANNSSSGDIIPFTIGDGQSFTPVDGDSHFTYSSILGKTIALQKNGFGFYTIGTSTGQYQRSNDNPGDGLGITLNLQGGDIFSTGETYILFIV